MNTNPTPPPIKTILKEAPVAYGVVVLMEYRKGLKTPAELLREWESRKGVINQFYDQLKELKNGYINQTPS